MQFGLSDDQIAAKAALMPVLRKELSPAAADVVALLRGMSAIGGSVWRNLHAWKQSFLSPVLMFCVHKALMLHAKTGISQPAGVLVVH